MEAYAVLETGGKQLLVRAGDRIEIEKLSVNEGDEIALDTVCAISDGTTLKVGTPYVEGAKVTLTIVAPCKKGVKTINFKAKRRKGYRRTVGHRQQYTIATVKALA
ncbi:MAG: 50S ribosomal protein L21 [Kiritimatiellia bacterium]